MIVIFAVIGSGALWLLYAWLLSCIVAGYLASRKGYSENAGISTGMLLFVVGPIVWAFVPPKEDSLWKREGPLPRRTRAPLD